MYKLLRAYTYYSVILFLSFLQKVKGVPLILVFNRENEDNFM